MKNNKCRGLSSPCGKTASDKNNYGLYDECSSYLLDGSEGEIETNPMPNTPTSKWLLRQHKEDYKTK